MPQDAGIKKNRLDYIASSLTCREEVYLLLGREELNGNYIKNIRRSSNSNISMLNRLYL